MKTKLKILMTAMAVVCTAAVAQTPDKPARLVGSGSGPILSRDELRACFKQEASVKQRLAAHDGERSAIDAEKAAIEVEKQSLLVAKAPVDEAKAKVEDLRTRMQAFGLKVAAWNKDVAAFTESAPTGRQADAKRNQINAERDALQKERNELEAENTKLSTDSAEAVKVFNAKATSLQPRVAAWNQRNVDWNSQGVTLEADRGAWISGCQNRRYREDDEVAIKKGK